jgi:hypothetical protein
LLVDKDASIRKGKGIPVVMGTGIDCPAGSGDCKMSIVLTRSFGNSFSYSTSSSQSVSLSNSMGQAGSMNDEQHGSVSDQVSNTLTKSVELSLGYSKNKYR